MARILILEQDLGVRELLRAVLEAEGHDCRCAADDAPGGADLLLVDPNWPAAREYGARARERCADIPIILSSHIVQPGTDLERLRPFRSLPRLFALDQVRLAVAAALPIRS